MDERTFQRYQAGDPEAATALESHLKELAASLLRHPGFELTDPVQLKVLSGAASREAMERGARDADSLKAAVVLAACRRAVDHVRRVEKTSEGEGHVPSGALVTVALLPGSMPALNLQAAEKHLAACPACARHVERIRDATAGATHAPVTPRAEPPPDGADEALSDGPAETPAGRIPAEPTGRVRTDPTGRVRTDSTGRVRTDPTGRVRTGARRGRAANDRSSSRTGPWIGAFLLVVGFVAWWFWPRTGPETPVLHPELAALADRTVPPLPPLDQRPKGAIAAYQDLQSGNCRTAATRFSMVPASEADALVRFYEGVARVCAGQGEEARAAFTAARSAPGTRPPELPWYEVQAALLAGDRETAITLLFDLETRQSDLQLRARALSARIREVSGPAAPPRD